MTDPGTDPAAFAERGHLGSDPTEAAELRRLIEDAARRNPSDGMLLSGGLDTSILAPLAAASGTRTAVTVLTSPDAPDREYARRIATELGWNHRTVEVPVEDLLAEVGFVARVLRSFDPMEVRNSIVIARGLREARALGCRTVMTGDAADELFGGYSFMWAKPPAEFEEYSRRMAETMQFSSVPLGRELGVMVRAPYTDPSVVRFATALPKGRKVGEHDGVTFGKIALREAFPETVSCWRRKDPIEVGSGTHALPEFFRARTSPERLAEEIRRIREEDRVTIRDAEHLAYYRAFREVFGDRPPLVRFGRNPCQGCGFELPRDDSTFCRTCGAYPARAVEPAR
jgi:asparagine synthase (glutamine-hydrolysing)